MVNITDAKYEKVKEHCLAKGKPWEDPDFPATATSIGPIDDIGDVVWMRPHEICANKGTVPYFIYDEADRFDVVQGGLGDCWVLAALASLTTTPQLFKRVVPPDQTFDKDKKYAGVFRFHFWKYGTWVEVLVDDRLPTVYGQLKFAETSLRGEFWGPLLEKAYAKFYGNYKTIKGGHAKDALTDFTGCMSQTIQFVDYEPSQLSKLVLKATERNAILSASVSKPKDAEKMGLVTGHAYSITGAKKVTLKDDTKVDLIRIRNPWGGNYEWNGRWSDSSEEWNKVVPQQLKEMGLEKKADGEYWMQLSDFQRFFWKMDMCYLEPTDFLDCPDGSPKCWSISTFYGKWTENKTAGGLNIYTPSFCKNPQFEVSVKDCDDEDDMASFVVELTQVNRRRQKLNRLCIGFYIYCILPGVKLPLNEKYLKDIKHIAGKADYGFWRAIVKSFTMNPGRYVIIPTTQNENEVGEFMIRVFSESEHQSSEIN